MISPREIITPALIEETDELLTSRTSMEEEIQRLEKITRYGNGILNRISETTDRAIAEICMSDEYSDLEKAAFCAVARDFANPPKSFEEFTELAETGYHRLAAINAALTESSQPILAFEAVADDTRNRIMTVNEYTFRFANENAMLVSPSVHENEHMYYLTIHENSPLNKNHARSFWKHPESPVIEEMPADGFLDLTIGPEKAIANLYEPPERNRATHLLIGDEVKQFFDIDREERKQWHGGGAAIDTMLGHAVRMGFEFDR